MSNDFSGSERSPPEEETASKAPDAGACGLEKVVERYYSLLYRFGLALTRNESEASDLTQETFYVWVSKGHQLRDPGKVQTWLFSVLYREFLRRRRYQARFVQDDGHVDSAPAETERAISLINQMDGAIARDALLALDDAYRQPLALFYLQQHSYREIAGILQLPLGTVMSRIWRGKVLLRKSLSDIRRTGDGSASSL